MNPTQHSKYLIGLVSAAKYQLAHRGQIVGRVILYTLIILLFSQVFTSVKGDDERIWYVSVTQLVSLSASPLAFQLVKDLSSKQFEYFMLRPLSYLSFRFSETMGSSLVNYTILWTCFIIICSSITTVHPNVVNIIYGSLYGILSMCLYVIITSIIGLLSFWVKDIKNIFYTNLTASFCFGGLIVPLDFYGPVIKKICFYTPYPWILWAPAQIINGKLNLLNAITYMAMWTGLLAWAIIILNKKCIKQFVVEGF